MQCPSTLSNEQHDSKDSLLSVLQLPLYAQFTEQAHMAGQSVSEDAVTKRRDKTKKGKTVHGDLQAAQWPQTKL